MNNSNSSHKVPERKFMTSLLKHTGIALVLLVPIAAYNSAAHAYDATSASKVTSVDKVDLNRYAGQWYEISRIPMYFQRKCASDVTANYTLNYNASNAIKSVTVENKCRKSDGSIMGAEGLAKTVNDTGSELKVTFLPSWLRWLPFGKGDYWVLSLDDNYQNALVGSPDNKYLWMLSRTPTMSQAKFNEYKALASKQGFDITKLEVTTHTGVAKTLTVEVN